MTWGGLSDITFIKSIEYQTSCSEYERTMHTEREREREREGGRQREREVLTVGSVQEFPVFSQRET